ncbi:AT DNA binding protein [Aspergillus sclerotiicarbonarius CBS 121057]|uniref:AT DNA binding protein n=1 Tax=Aspergillus sclerotiicarbonarius (strain CBS 121057 / IBT 28362) TaxID=1448318 RepID=A0A319FJB3_ASPSB|nr:AT DNA binding protein [Aspergillus sclerotiicarbonarius CBS 121057]
MTDSDTALVPWENINEQFFGSQRMLLESTSTPQITSLLSACSYPVPQQIRQSQRGPGYIHAPLLGIVPENSLHYDNNDMQATQPAAKPPKRPRGDVNRSGSSLNKRGRPRKVVEGAVDEDPEERRRRQIRLAQRAYRSRKEANISSLKSRISELETVVEKMSTAVLSFSDELVQSGVLAANASLTEHLRDTVQTCLTLAREASNDGEQEIPIVSPPQTEQGSPEFVTPEQQSQPLQIVGLNESLPSSFDPNFSLRLGLAGPQNTASRKSLRFFESLETSEMDLPLFTDRLHMSCVYQGCFALCDDSIDMDRIQKHFCLLLQIMDRKRLASYFRGALNEKESRKRFEEWEEVPFFSLGGAGTHYSRSSLKCKAADRPFRPGVRWVSVRSLSHFPPHIQKQLEGDWFDMGDLEGYLREQDVRLLTYPPIDHAQYHSKRAINAARFIQALSANAICLGWTPGFSRRDVENALQSCIWK